MKTVHILLVLLVSAIAAFPQLCAGDTEEVITDTNIATPAKSVMIDPLSGRPLYLIQAKGDEVLGTATGFIVEHDKAKYLITNKGDILWVYDQMVEIPRKAPKAWVIRSER